MTTEKFNRMQFENALPSNKTTGKELWVPLGLIQGEYAYTIELPNNIDIMIRSSVRSDGYAASSGKDSIRLWLVKGDKPHGSKLSKYITRVAGWELRLIAQLRVMYARSMSLARCPKCYSPKAIFKTKKTGKLFQACPDHFAGTHENYDGK